MLGQGDLLREYEIQSVIGRGGFGVVYKGKHQELGIDVAIKEYFPPELSVRQNQTIQPSNPELQESFEEGLNRFLDEARQLVNFRDHPNIVTCSDLFRANGTAYMVMDYIFGLPLSTLLEQRESQSEPFTEQDLLSLIPPLLNGLRAVHEQGVCHRDIKPSNILVRRSDGVPVLIDFGAAKHEISKQTKSFAPYTDGYAAMEQVGDGKIGPWTDMYGLGAVMWRMIAGGNPPFTPANPLPVQKRAFEMMQGQSDPLPSASEIGKGRFSNRILQAIDNCLIINLNERVQTCGELLKVFNKSSITSEDDNSRSNTTSMSRVSQPQDLVVGQDNENSTRTRTSSTIHTSRIPPKQIIRKDIPSDKLFEPVARVAVRAQLVSVSQIAIQFGIDETQASNIIAQLERYGIVGPSRGESPRKVLISNEVELETLLSNRQKLSPSTSWSVNNETTHKQSEFKRGFGKSFGIASGAGGGCVAVILLVVVVGVMILCGVLSGIS